MNEKATIFPLPAGAELREQADAMARAAWLMGAPDGSGDPPEPPGVDPVLPRDSPPAGAHCRTWAVPFLLGGEGPLP